MLHGRGDSWIKRSVFQLTKEQKEGEDIRHRHSGLEFGSVQAQEAMGTLPGQS